MTTKIGLSRPLTTEEKIYLGVSQRPLLLLKYLHRLNKPLAHLVDVVSLGPEQLGLQVMAKKDMSAGTLVAVAVGPYVPDNFLGITTYAPEGEDDTLNGYDLFLNDGRKQNEGKIRFAIDPTGMKRFCKGCVAKGFYNVHGVANYLNHAYTKLPSNKTVKGTVLLPNCKMELVERHVGGIRLLTMNCVTIRNIKKGDLLLWDYGCRYAGLSEFLIQTREDVERWKTENLVVRNHCDDCKEAIDMKLKVEESLLEITNKDKELKRLREEALEATQKLEETRRKIRKFYLEISEGTNDSSSDEDDSSCEANLQDMAVQMVGSLKGACSCHIKIDELTKKLETEQEDHDKDNQWHMKSKYKLNLEIQSLRDQLEKLKKRKK